jgi:hypothetical protein
LGLRQRRHQKHTLPISSSHAFAAVVYALLQARMQSLTV